MEEERVGRMMAEANRNFLVEAIKKLEIKLVEAKKKVATPHDPAKTYQLAKKLMAEEDQLTYLPPMNYQNGYDLAVTKAFAKKHNIKSLSDLAKVGASLTAAFDPDFANQQDGGQGVAHGA